MSELESPRRRRKPARAEMSHNSLRAVGDLADLISEAGGKVFGKDNIQSGPYFRTAFETALVELRREGVELKHKILSAKMGRPHAFYAADQLIIVKRAIAILVHRYKHSLEETIAWQKEARRLLSSDKHVTEFE